MRAFAPWLVSLVLLVSSVARGDAARDKEWKQPAMPLKDVAGVFVPGYLSATLKSMEPDRRATLESDLAGAERFIEDPKERVAWATLNSSFLEALGFSDVARVYAMWAVKQGPDSKLAVANLAAITCVPGMLKLAVELDPKNPIPLCNLASCALSAEQWELARTSYEAALKLDEHHRTALLGLVQYWLHVPDVGRAIEYAVRANGYALVKNDKGQLKPPDKPVEPKQNRQGGGPAEPSSEGGGGEGEGGASRIAATKLELPPLPNWPSPDAFIVSGKSRKALGKFYAEKAGAALKAAAKMMKSNPFAQSGDPLDAALNPKWDDSEPSRALAANYAWASEKLRKANEEYKVAEKEYKKLGKAIAEVANARNKRIEQLCPAGARGLAAAEKCIKGAREEMAESCKLSLSLVGKMFAAYRDSYQRWYQQVKPVYEELWHAQNLWLRQISDDTIYDVAIASRDAFIFGPLSIRMTEEDLMRLVFVGEGAAAFGQTAEVCPKEPPPKLEEELPPKPPDVSGPGRDCPLPKDGLDIPPVDVPGFSLPFSFNVKCKEASVKFTAGFGKWKSKNEMVSGGAGAVLKVTHRFGTDKSTVVYVGVEAGAKAKTAAGSSVGVKAGGGVAVEFNRNWQVTNVDTNVGVSTSLDLPAGAGKATIGITGAVEKGAPDIGYKASASGANPFF